ncbi:LLM class flavin-dependent oxidoreductase [Falsigemmobacter intermedius]|uniref:LLM class flavin-dependent oxidoreductase n=1 Tax=Falsigemmobacter intermedius TaxID=1553448 RepID=A0A451GHC9_9RHOB|nr:LLM class flavin-dependent oxidoreductase [Falsigemmobacter intermedius]RWY37663.1 LLM class flavin-dependent oxidoreductase [Falsigemmobacter intermedius]
MKVGVSINTLNTADWDRVKAQDWDRPAVRPDWEAMRATMKMGDLVEPLGFDSLWSSEHFGTPYGMVPNPLQFLTYWAGRTQRIELGSLVVVLPWWNPVRLAHEIAFLDNLMEGRRLRLGVGRGVARQEFDVLGVDQNTARERVAEGIDILKRALSQERWSYDGEIWQIPENSIRPQWRSPDIMQNALGAATGPESMDVLASRGLLQLFTTGLPPEKVAENVKYYNSVRLKNGYAPSQPTVYMWGYCTDSADEAAEVTETNFKRYQQEAADHYGFNDAKRFEGLKGYERYDEQIKAGKGGATGSQSLEFSQMQFIGTPEKILENAEKLQRLTSACEVVTIFQYGGLSDIRAEKSMRKFAADVLPQLQAMKTPMHAHCLPDGYSVPTGVAAE